MSHYDYGVPRAPRARSMTHQEWIDRAVEMAWQQHTIGNLRYLTTDSEFTHYYSAHSALTPHYSAMVKLNLDRGTITCDCIAAQYGLPCSHLGAAWAAWVQIEKRPGSPPEISRWSTSSDDIFA